MTWDGVDTILVELYIYYGDYSVGPIRAVKNNGLTNNKEKHSRLCVFMHANEEVCYVLYII